MNVMVITTVAAALMPAGNRTSSAQDKRGFITADPRRARQTGLVCNVALRTAAGIAWH